MARLAPTRLAGTIAAMGLCAAATEAATQDPGLVLNGQINNSDVFAGQTLNVVNAEDQVTASTYAVGNRAAVSGDDGVGFQVQSTQTMTGDGRSTIEMNLSGETEGPVTLTAQVEGNRLEAQAYGADLGVEATQTMGAADLIADVAVNGAPGRMLDGGRIQSSASGNVTAMAGSGGVLTADIDQTSAAFTQAYTYGNPQYVPARAEFTAEAIGNTVASTVTQGDQDLTIRQRQTGAPVWATTSANAGNAWDLAGRARATANHVAVANQGGSVISRTDQGNAAGVRAESIVTAYDFGQVTSHAGATANSVHVGNADIYVRIDNSQVNSGGVEAIASFQGNGGYDAYVGADAAGNTVTAYSCANCPGYLEAANTQVNTGNVTAAANTRIDSNGRAVITGVNAVGNSATFYVTRPGGN
ncbi:MAG: holdfast anchor protein HfaD [Brevundimonas sp.]|uniref:holdfast anchor protein HfaD n=1 Tax=Brevundimonas sp. TaxID=1871086 RepID=UPI00391B284E